MTKEPVACDASEPVTHAAQLMRDKNVGCVVALENGRASGMVTDRDIAMCVADEDTDCTVEDVMHRELGRIRPDDDLFHAVDTFRSAGVVRRLPVVNDRDELVGLLSISDLAVVAQDLLGAIMLEETSEAQRPHILTGGKSVVKRIRRPSKADQLPERETHVVGPASPGAPPKSGRGSA